MDREEKMKKSLKIQFAYITIYSVLCVLETFLMPEIGLSILEVIGAVYIIIHTFFIKYNRNWLFANGLICAISVLQLGILVGKKLALVDLCAIGIAISLVDVLSFTKAGKHTMNAKAMSNVNFMSKLIVYGKGKNDILYPTCGIGDFFYYAIWISGLITVTDHVVYFVIGSCLILLGTGINSYIINKIYKKENYKGFPATIIPFVCIGVEYVVLYLVK